MADQPVFSLQVGPTGQQKPATPVLERPVPPQPTPIPPAPAPVPAPQPEPTQREPEPEPETAPAPTAPSQPATPEQPSARQTTTTTTKTAREKHSPWPHLIRGIVALALVLVSLLMIGGFVGKVIALAVVLLVFYVGVAQRFVDRTTGRPIPSEGKPARIHAVLRACGISYIPKQSTAELIRIEGDKHDLLRQTHHGEIVVFGLKGGVGKSTVVAIWSWLSAKHSVQQVLVMDSRNKPGDIASRLGLKLRKEPLGLADHTTVSLRQLLELYTAGWLQVPTIAQTIIGRLAHMTLWVVGADTPDTAKGLFVDVPLFARMTDWLANIFRLLIHECSDDIGHELDLELNRRCDVPVFVHRANMRSSDENLVRGVLVYLNQSDASAKKIREHGHLIVLATVPGQTPETVLDDPVFEPIRGVFAPDRIRLVPYDKFFDNDARRKPAGRQSQNSAPKPIFDFDKMPEAVVLAMIQALNSAIRHMPTISAEGIPPTANPSVPNTQKEESQ